MWTWGHEFWALVTRIESRLWGEIDFRVYSYFHGVQSARSSRNFDPFFAYMVKYCF